MKKITFIAILIVTCFNLNSFAQKIEENQTDDFTKTAIKRTSWENFFTTMTANSYFRISQLNDTEYFDLKYQDGTLYTINKDDQLMLKLDNGEIITLTCRDYVVSCTGCGAKGITGSTAEGFEAYYALTKEQSDKLKTAKIVKVRIVTNKGNLESDIKDKNAAKVITSLNLI